MPRCFIALGGNVGPVAETFRQALSEIARDLRVCVVRTSSIVRSAAVGERAGGDFQNAAAELDSSLAPLELLDLLQEVESKFGRLREHRWGPRTLDLDLLFYGSEVVDVPGLRVPHPACWYRRFVIDPLSEIAADFVHPEKQVRVAELRSRLLARPLTVCLAGGDAAVRENLVVQLRAQLPAVRFEDWLPGRMLTPPEPAVIAWLGPEESSGTGEFHSLPLIPRLDASGVARGERLSFLRDVAAAALG